MLLCDEPTSNVDFASDTRVMDTLLGLDCAVLLNAHRLQHIRRFDRVVILDGGTLVEDGTPAELLSDARSRLSAMWRASQGSET